MKKIFYILLIGSLLMSGCKSYKKTAETNAKKISKVKLFKQLKKHRFNAKTFESRFAISYTDKKQSLSGNGKLRILKDSVIWGSLNFLGIPMLKFYITPTKIKYYNKIDRTYYDGDFTLLEKKIGVPINFEHLQNLLTGDLISNLKIENVTLENTPKTYILKTADPFIKSAEIYPFFKIKSELTSKQQTGSLYLQYFDYQSFKKNNLPKNIHIKSRDRKMKLIYKNIILNKKLNFPFKLPSSYTPLKL